MNMLDYLDWRGDLRFDRVELNPVDALIFAWISYYRFEELGDVNLDGLTLAGLVALREERCGAFEKPALAEAVLPTTSAAWLLRCASRVPRFADVCVRGFQRLVDDAQGVQFTAISFLIPGGPRVIAYRGTDDSLAGWREDCNLSFMDSVPAQRLALRYLEDAKDGREVILCGHSKGGNLAMYAALCASEERCRDIRFVYDFDGPGFCFDIRDAGRYERVKRHSLKVVPESSIVGMLLNHGDDYRIVRSRMSGLFQHDAMFWQVMGGDFVYASRRSATSIVMDNALREWIDGMSNDQRKAFVSALFDVLESTGAELTDELPEKLLRGGGLRKLAEAASIYPEQKRMLLRLLMEMVRASNASLYESLMNHPAMRELSQSISEGSARVSALIDRVSDAISERFAPKDRAPDAAPPEGDASNPSGEG